ncbi:hypothetical protein JCM11641_003807 [Rhodosporidiobolus odoratus]
MPPKRKSTSKAEDASASTPTKVKEDSPLTEQESEPENKPPKKKAKKAKEPVKPIDSSLPTNLTVPDPLQAFARPGEGKIRISAWNVAGLRASEKKGFSRYVEAEDADILVVTETKTTEIKLDSLERYEHCYWGNSNKKGQAGTAIFSKIKPLNVSYGMEDSEGEFTKGDSEGRLVTLEFENSYVVGTYVPNAGQGLKSLDVKKAWNRAFERYLRQLDAKKPVIWCGDLNVVPTEKDIRNWKTNYNKSAGCTDAEIDGFHGQLNPASGSEHKPLVDVWRHLHPDTEGHYSYISYKFQCRSKGIGWRLDFFVASERIMSKIKSCEMRHEIWGASDHLPLVLDVEGPL